MLSVTELLVRHVVVNNVDNSSAHLLGRKANTLYYNILALSQRRKRVWKNKTDTHSVTL